MPTQEEILQGLLTEQKKLTKIVTALLKNQEVDSIPSDAESFDIQQLCEVEKNTTSPFRMLTLKAEQNEQIVITHFAIYTDALVADEIEFIPKLNGNRCLRFHGRPDSPTEPTVYKLNLGLSPDLSENSLRRALITLSPLQILTWDVLNNSTTDSRPMGVRLKGYKRSLVKVVDSLNR